jgi:hypothetical protein
MLERVILEIAAVPKKERTKEGRTKCFKATTKTVNWPDIRLSMVTNPVVRGGGDM